MKLEIEIIYKDGFTRTHSLWPSPYSKSLEEAVMKLCLTKSHYKVMIKELYSQNIYTHSRNIGKCIYRLLPS